MPPRSTDLDGYVMESSSLCDVHLTFERRLLFSQKLLTFVEYTLNRTYGCKFIT